MDLLFQCVVGWTVEFYMLFLGTKSLELHVKLVYRLIVGFLGWFGWFDYVQFTLLIFYMICVLSFLSSFWFLFLFYFCFLFEILWVYLLQTLTRPHSSTWVTKGFKGLVACAECNRDSYDSELDFRFCFCFTRGRAKFKCGGICLSSNLA